MRDQDQVTSQRRRVEQARIDAAEGAAAWWHAARLDLRGEYPARAVWAAMVDAEARVLAEIHHERGETP